MTPARPGPIRCAHGCTIPGRHLDVGPTPCADDTCPGCLPALAATGLAVCSRCERRVRDGLRDLPGLWADLGDPRTSRAPRSGGADADRDTGSPMLITDDRRQARSAIRLLLVTWCRVLEDDFAVGLPADTVRAMAHHVAVQAGRLLASEHADQLVHDVTAAAREARRLTTPRRRGITIACSCGGRVHVTPDATATFRCPDCEEWGTLSWWRQQLSTDDTEPMTLTRLADWLLVWHGVDVTPQRLRTWADEGRLTPVQGGGQGRQRKFDPIASAVIVQTLIGRRRITA